MLWTPLMWREATPPSEYSKLLIDAVHSDRNLLVNASLLMVGRSVGICEMVACIGHDIYRHIFIYLVSYMSLTNVRSGGTADESTPGFPEKETQF